MTPRKPFLAVVFSLLVALGLLAACGGGGESGPARSGQLTDPHSVPTATPWVKPPDVIILEPGAITPISGGGEAAGETPQPGTEPAPGQCGKKYTVKGGDSPSLIAEKCGVGLQALLDANPGIEPTNLHIGDVLNIPQ